MSLINFIKDSETLTKEMLSNYGVNYTRALTGEIAIRIYLSVRFKVIGQQQRQVIKSIKFQNKFLLTLLSTDQKATPQLYNCRKLQCGNTH